MTRPALVFHCYVERTQAVEFYVAVETWEEAEAAAREVVRAEVDDWGCADHDFAIAHQPSPVDAGLVAGAKELGIWVPDKNPAEGWTRHGKGTWVFHPDDVPEIPTPVDPNQGVLEGVVDG